MILLIGSTGYIGTEFRKQFDILNINYLTLSYKDITKNKLIKFVKENNIKYIINSAAFVGKPNIEACETQKDQTISGNILLPYLLKEVCEECDIILGHISTGCLYNGESSNGMGWSENDKPNFSFNFNNCSFYTGTKVIAEDIVKLYPKSYIWRIRLPFENIHNERNYISKIINYDTLITNKNSISHKEEFVRACIDSIKLKIPFGIYNITNSGSISAVDIVEKLTKTIMPDKKSRFLSMKEFYETISSMPRSNCIIDNTKILSMGIKLSDVNESIDNCLRNWRW
jgi:dTDP-4-dehydrorhamnose reductase